MDWKTIRVLTANLQELLDEIEKGTHATGHGSVRESWRLGIITIPKTLLVELGYPSEEGYIHPENLSLSWPGSDQFMGNPYLRRAAGTAELAHKLISDFDNQP